MIDATVAPKVGIISPFGTTVCNVNHINAAVQARPSAQREGVAWNPGVDMTSDVKRWQ
jgi:hypothetical protein